MGIERRIATPKPVITSKNYKRQHIIYLMALTDITKTEDNKYEQKNHFLWIKNLDGLVYKDNTKKVKKHQMLPKLLVRKISRLSF